MIGGTICRVCKALKFNASTYHYKSRRRGQAALKRWIKEICETHSRYCPATGPPFSYRGEDVVQTLECVFGQVGYPKTIRVDNGSEFISRDLDLWGYAYDVVCQKCQ